MRSRNYFFILVLVLSLTFVSSMKLDTTIKVDTAPNFNVTISIKDTAGYYHFATKDSGADGSVLLGFTLETSSYELATFTLKRFGDDDPAYFKRFDDEPYSTGDFVELEIYPKWYTPPEPENETLVTIPENNTSENTTQEIALNETETTNVTSPKNKDHKLTAFSVSDGELRINGRVLLYALGLIFIGIFILLFIRWERKKPKQEKKIKITKLSEFQQINNEGIKQQEDKIEQAKKMLQQAQEELKKLKDPNMNKIEQAKKKLIEDQKELMKLREEAKKTEQQTSENNQEKDKE